MRFNDRMHRPVHLCMIRLFETLQKSARGFSIYSEPAFCVPQRPIGCRFHTRLCEKSCTHTIAMAQLIPLRWLVFFLHFTASSHNNVFLSHTLKHAIGWLDRDRPIKAISPFCCWLSVCPAHAHHGQTKRQTSDTSETEKNMYFMW